MSHILRFIIPCLLLLLLFSVGQTLGEQHRPALPTYVRVSHDQKPPQPSQLPIKVTLYPLPQINEESENKESENEKSEPRPSGSGEQTDSEESPAPSVSAGEETAGPLWHQTKRPETESIQTSTPPSLPDMPKSQRRSTNETQPETRNRKFSPPAPSTKGEEKLKSMPDPPSGETDRQFPPILTNDTSNEDTGSDREGMDTNPDEYDNTGDGSSEAIYPSGPKEQGDGPPFQSGNTEVPPTSQPPTPNSIADTSPWTESALMILATVSTLSFLCMLYIADVYRRRWLNALMSQNGILPGTLPPFGSQDLRFASRTPQDGFYEFPFSTRYDE